MKCSFTPCAVSDREITTQQDNTLQAYVLLAMTIESMKRCNTSNNNNSNNNGNNNNNNNNTVND